MPAFFLRRFEKTRRSYEGRDDDGDDEQEAEGEVELSGQDVHSCDGFGVFGAAAVNEGEIPYCQGRGKEDQ